MSTARGRRPLKIAAIGICAAVNIFIFLAFPAYCSYRSVRQFEAQLDGIRTALPQLGAPNDLLILCFDSHFLGYRHAGYYLPGYLTLQYPEVKLNEGTRIFAMQGQDTRLLASLPAGSYKRFVVFPFTRHECRVPALSRYLQKAASRPGPRVRGRAWPSICDWAHSGSASAFPPCSQATARATRARRVYAPLHSGSPFVNIRLHRPRGRSLTL